MSRSSWSSRAAGTPTGMRPRTVRDHRFNSAYIFGAVCPDRCSGMALVVGRVSAEAMNLMLTELGPTVSETAAPPR
jgi:hypothetical protein